MNHYPQDKQSVPYFDNLKSDILFKYIMTDPTDNYYVLRDVIKAFTGKIAKEVIIRNNEIPRDANDKKGLILDVLAKDENGNYFNFEMQNSIVTENELLRFQCYNCELVCQQVQKGKNYKGNVKEVYSVILTDYSFGPKLMDHYQMKSEDGASLKYGLQHIIIVSLPNINLLGKKANEMNEVEQYINVFKNGFDGAILNMNRGVWLMKERVNAFNEEALLRIIAINEEQKAFSIELAKQEAIQEAVQEAVQKTEQRSELKIVIQNCQSLMESLNKSLEEVMDLLKLDDCMKTKVKEALK